MYACAGYQSYVDNAPANGMYAYEGYPSYVMVNLNSHDVIVLCTGANDMYMNNSSVAILKIIKFVMNNSDANIIIIGVPHRYDLSDHSCVNKAIQSFNGKLKNITTLFNYVTVIEYNHKREHTNKGINTNPIKYLRQEFKQIHSSITLKKVTTNEVDKIIHSKSRIPMEMMTYQQKFQNLVLLIFYLH